MYGYIYLTTNTINGKKYIGRHKSDVFDIYYKGSGRVLKEALKKYGRENFKCEILEWCETTEDAYQKEKYWVDYYDSVNNPMFYNLTEGGCGPLEVPEDVKQRLRTAFTGDSNPSKRPDVREKIRQGKIGPKNPNFGKHNKCSEETKEKLRKVNTGRKMSDMDKKKMSLAKIGKPSNRKRKIIINEVEYESVTQAMQILHISTRKLYRLLEQEGNGDVYV